MRLILLAAALLATPAFAQDRQLVVPAVPGQPPPTVIVEPAAMMIAAFDSDGDARVTRAEFDAGLRRSFDSANPRDGAIGYIGYSDWSERWLGDRNTLPSPFEIDRDGDNKITFDELAARFGQLFTRFDADKDDVLVRRELVTIRPQMPGPQSPGGRRGRPRRN